MAERISLQELFNSIAELLDFKNNTLSELNDIAYRNFRQIILFRDKNIKSESDRFEDLQTKTLSFIQSLSNQLPPMIAKISYNHEISPESKLLHKSNLLSTKGVNELLGLVEAIALELTRDESYESRSEAQNEIKDLVNKVKKLSGEIKDFIQKLQNGIEILPPAAMYTVEGHIIGVALIMVYSFVVAFNVSFIRLNQDKYEEKMGIDKELEQYTDVLLPLLGIPGYILLHYISTRISLKYSFMVSIILLIGGNIFYYLAETINEKKGSVSWMPGNLDLWFYLIGKGIIVSRLPLYGVKQFIGFKVEPSSRVQVSTCSVAAIFMGYACGYFLSLTTQGYSGEFLGLTTNEDNAGGLFIGSFWVIIFFFCSVLFVNPDKQFESKPHRHLYIQALTIISYILPFALLQLFVSNHARPKFEEDWDNTKFFTFLGVFCLMALPVHIFVYISSYFTTDKTLISLYKVMIIVAGPIYLLSENSDVSREFWYVAGSLLIIMGVNMGIGVSFAMLAGNIKNHRIGLFAGVLEVIGLVFGNFAALNANYYYFQVGIIVTVLLTFILDIVKYKEFDPLRVNSENNEIEDNKKND